MLVGVRFDQAHLVLFCFQAWAFASAGWHGEMSTRRVGARRKLCLVGGGFDPKRDPPKCGTPDLHRLHRVFWAGESPIFKGLASEDSSFKC